MIDNGIDDLFSPRPSGSGRGGRRRPDRRRRGGRGRAVPKLLLTLVVVAAVLGAGIYGIGKVVGRVGGGESSADFTGPGDGAVIVRVPDGASAREIGRILAASGVVETPGAFVNVVGANDASSQLQPGYFQLKQHMSAANALKSLLDPAVQNQFRIVVAPGTTVRKVITSLAAKTGLPLSDFEKVAKNPAGLGLPSYARTLEGYFYPGTYELAPTTSALAAMKPFVDRFKTETAALDFAGGAQRLGLRGPQDIVTVASIIEREVADPGEATKVARVIYNRLDDRTGRFPTLGMDSTTRYAENEYEGPLTQSQLARSNPYNTRVVKGLPPGAIANPGTAALNAALHPATGSWVWFVSLPKSNVTVFASTQAEWDQDLAKYHAEGGG